MSKAGSTHWQGRQELTRFTIGRDNGGMVGLFFWPHSKGLGLTWGQAPPAPAEATSS